MNTNVNAHAASYDSLWDLLDALLIDMQSDAVSADRARVARALKHAAEYAIMAAEMVLEHKDVGQIVTPSQALSWAAAKLDEARDGFSKLTEEPNVPH